MVEALYRLHRQALYGYCLSMTESGAWAEDLCQEVFVRAMEHYEELAELQEKQRRAWLYKTARNLFIDQVRRQAREQNKAPVLLEPEEYEEQGFSNTEVWELLGALPPLHRELCLKRYVQGYNARELGEMYGEPPSTIRSKLKEARNILKQQLKEKK